MTLTKPAVLREAVIDVSAIAENTARIRALTGTDVLAVVKAEAYGHGAVRTARAALAGGASMLGVTDVSEALELRGAGITAPVLSWMHGPQTDFAVAIANDITLGVSSLQQLDAVIAVATEAAPATVHLKLETGLSRNGLAPAEWREAFAAAAAAERAGLLSVEGVFSHLSNTSEQDDRTALGRFTVGVEGARAAGLTPRVRHIAATAAALGIPESRLDLVRIGIGLHGLTPDPEHFDAAALGLRPSMTLQGTVIAVRRVPEGAGLSYGYTYRAPRETTLALVPLGYADGVPRAVSDRATVSIGGAQFAIAGRVAMDQFIVDVGDAPVDVGDPVVLFGDAAAGYPTADSWAQAADTINYEIVTRIGPRVPRREVSA